MINMYLVRATCLGLMIASSATVRAQERYFNRYVLKAVDHISRTRAGLGYDNSSYTQNIPFSSDVLKATNPPLTMCVAAQIEIIADALSLYVADSKDPVVYKFLPIVQWRAIRSTSFRGKVWIADRKSSHGTASALAAFGMGEEISFSRLKPGAFINLNRNNNTGHAVVFLAYLDGNGNLVSAYGPAVKGFKYFSAQGTRDRGGFGYRYAFFEKSGCPVLPVSMKRDCGIIFSDSQAVLNSGQMLMPKNWSTLIRDQALRVDSLAPKGPPPKFDFNYFNGSTTDGD
jgi:hypothetical protein